MWLDWKPSVGHRYESHARNTQCFEEKKSSALDAPYMLQNSIGTNDVE
jgi:hypothetical protein